MLFLTALLSCSALVAAAPRILNKKDLAITMDNRMSPSDVIAYQIKKAECWKTSDLVWPMNDMPLPVRDGTPAKQLKLYKIAKSEPGKLKVHNYCDYDIHFQHVGPGEVLDEGTLKAGGQWETVTSLGSNFKASRPEDPSRVVQVEYNRAVGSKDLWYNLSLIDCLVKKDKRLTKDATGCVGLEAGLQFGNSEQMSFQCAPGTWCDDQAYFYFENMCKNTNPVAVCSADLGLTMEFCASKKP